jgi:hypothetical protein
MSTLPYRGIIPLLLTRLCRLTHDGITVTSRAMEMLCLQPVQKLKGGKSMPCKRMVTYPED